MLELTIIVDENDADYHTKVSNIPEKNLGFVLALIAEIKKFKQTEYQKHNYPMGDAVRGDLGEVEGRDHYKFEAKVHELFESLCPQPEHGFHSIITIKICSKPNKKRLL